MAVIDFTPNSPEARACDRALHDEHDLPVLGARLSLVSMGDDPDPLPIGTLGTVTGHSYMPGPAGGRSQIWMKWDNGRTLSLIQGADLWAVVGYDEGWLARRSLPYIPALLDALEATPTGIFGLGLTAYLEAQLRWKEER